MCRPVINLYTALVRVCSTNSRDIKGNKHPYNIVVGAAQKTNNTLEKEIRIAPETKGSPSNELPDINASPVSFSVCDAHAGTICFWCVGNERLSPQKEQVWQNASAVVHVRTDESPSKLESPDKINQYHLANKCVKVVLRGNTAQETEAVNDGNNTIILNGFNDDESLLNIVDRIVNK